MPSKYPKPIDMEGSRLVVNKRKPRSRRVNEIGGSMHEMTHIDSYGANTDLSNIQAWS